MIATAAPAELDTLADGVVTESEREQSFLRFATCTQQHGMMVTSYKLHKYGAEHWAFKDTVELTAAQENAIEDDCYKQFYQTVTAVYLEENRRTVAQETAFAAEVSRCMQDAGVNIGSALSRPELAKVDASTYSDCAERLDP